SATHHPERSLLPAFWFLALVLGSLGARWTTLSASWSRVLLVVPLLMAMGAFEAGAERRGFAQRDEEELIGGLLRRLDAEAVALDTDDFGFFAVQAALGSSDGKSFTLSDHDPRKREPARPLSTSELAARLRKAGARWLVTTRERGRLAAS